MHDDDDNVAIIEVQNPIRASDEQRQASRQKAAQLSLREFAYHYWEAWKGASEQEEQDIAHLIAQEHDGQITLMAMPWGNEQEKAAILAAVSKVLQSGPYVRYLFIGEVWSREATKEQIQAKGNNVVMPSQDPNRVEQLMIVGVERYSHDMITLLGKITNTEGKRHIAEPEEITGLQHGRIAELFGDETFHVKH